MFKKTDKRKIIGYYRPCDILTMTGTIFGITCMILALSGKTGLAIVALVISGICDAFDGYLARLHKYDKVETSYGVELDSLSDLISFGVAPAFLTLSIVGFNHFSSILVCIFYIMAGLIRLAYFNTLEINNLDIKGCFKGVPITSIAIIYPLAYFIFSLFGFIYFDIVITVILFLVGVAFVVPIKIKKLTVQSRTILSIFGLIFIIISIIKFLA